MIDVQFVDDHMMVVDSLSKIIDESGIAQVTGKYHDLKSCREALRKGMFGVLLLDIDLPDGNGVNFCDEVRKNYPELKIIMLTGYKEFSIVKHALHNGALGYILKNATLEEMITGIETVSRGKQFLCKETDMLLKKNKDKKVIWLTNREKEVLKYTADGCTVKEIADLIFRGVETVKFNRKKLFLKLGAKNLAELIKIAYEMKLI